MLSLRLVVMSAILVFATACGGGYSSPSTDVTVTDTVTHPTPGGPSSSVAISVGASSLRNTAYSPDELNVAAGTTVIWTNTDSVSHTSTSDATGWDSGIVAPGGKFSVAFQTPGRFSYHCAIHPGMIGTVVVN